MKKHGRAVPKKTRPNYACDEDIQNRWDASETSWPSQSQTLGLRDGGCGMRDAGWLRDAGCGMQDAGCGMRDAGPSFPLNFPAHLMHWCPSPKSLQLLLAWHPSSRTSADPSKSKYINTFTLPTPPKALDLGLGNYGLLSKFYRFIGQRHTSITSPNDTRPFLGVFLFTHLKPPLLISYKREPAQIYLDSRCYKGFCWKTVFFPTRKKFLRHKKAITT